MDYRSLKEYFEQFLYTLYSYPQAVSFTRRKRLWEGFWKYGWVTRLLILLALIAGIKFFTLLVDWFQGMDASDPMAMIGSVNSFFTDVAYKEFSFLFTGGLKYAMLALLEILIFHIVRRTFTILSGEDSETGFNAFVQAQIRMLKVTFRSYIIESVATTIIHGAIGAYGFLMPLGSIAILGVQAYYTGFTIIDNYHEQFGLTIKESIKESRQYIGVVIALGLTLQVLFIVPLLGTILGPILATVAVALVMFDLSGLHRNNPYQTPVPQA